LTFALALVQRALALVERVLALELVVSVLRVQQQCSILHRHVGLMIYLGRLVVVVWMNNRHTNSSHKTGSDVCV
jgi:hypothetical protein